MRDRVDGIIDEPVWLSSDPVEDHIERLKEATASLNRNETFKEGDIVTWKPHMRNKVAPASFQTFQHFGNHSAVQSETMFFMLDKQEAQSEKIETVEKNLEENMETLQKTVSTIQKRQVDFTKTFNQKHNELKNSHDKTQKNLVFLAKDHADFKKETSRRFDEIDKRFDKIDDRFERVDDKFDRLYERLDRVSHELRKDIRSFIEIQNQANKEFREDIKALTAKQSKISGIQEEQGKAIEKQHAQINLGFNKLFYAVIGATLLFFIKEILFWNLIN
ncbi:hypothetical protein ACQZV8_17860 [Magnetococcales bacterium HHB-1]